LIINYNTSTEYRCVAVGTLEYTYSHIWKVPGSKFGLEVGYPVRDTLWFPSYPPYNKGKCPL